MCSNDNGLFMVKIDIAAYKECVVSYGPEIILDHYLVVFH